MEKERPKERSSLLATKFIRFLGGRNLLFTLVILLLVACVIFMFNQVSFIFTPLQVLFEVVILPGVLAVIGYYLLRPLLAILVRWRIPRIWGILILYIAVIGVITLLVVLVYPFLRDQFTNLAQEFPEYFMAFTQNIVEFLNHSRFNEYLDKISFNFDEVLNNFTTDMVKTVISP